MNRWHISTTIDKFLVSTVNLGYSIASRPYETMVFDVIDGKVDCSGVAQFGVRRYKTVFEAERGHEEVCNEVREAIKNGEII